MEYCKQFLTLVAVLAATWNMTTKSIWEQLGLICWNISLVHNGLSHMAMTHGLVLKET
jgi:hypothetical protein